MVKTHTKKITAFLSVVAMLFSMLLYFPGGTFSSHDLGLTVSAEGEEGVTFTAIAGTGDGDEGYASLIDGKFTESNFSKWCVTGFTSVADGGNGAYIIFSASEPISVTGYSIVTGNDNAEWIDRNPKSWTLYGCNDETANSAAGKDSTSWEVIDAITDDTQLEDKNYTEYVYDELTGSTSTRYQYFKLEITATQGADVLQMSEFILHNRVKTDTTIAPTCTEGGYDVYECSICGWQKKVSDGTPALGHNFVEGVCTRCGVADTTPKEPSVDNGVYQIGTAGELYWFAGLVNGDASVCDYDETDNPTGTKQNTSANAVLTADITVNSNLLNSLNDDGTVPEGTTVTSWTPIGWYDVDNDIGYSYTGTFDGNSHTVSGLYFNNISTDCVGLFGYVGSGGSVSNLGVEDSYFKGRFHIGGVCGKNDGTITNCYHTGAVSATGEYASVGGVCGYNYNGTITNCYNTGAVNATYENAFVGGVCGNNSGGTITNCYNTGAVSGTGSDARIGGVCGENYYAGGTATVTNCYNTGAVSTGSSDWVGGVCGGNYGTITNCYNAGVVIGSSNVGGVCGANGSSSIITNCSNKGEVSGTDYVSGVCGYNYYGTIKNCYNASKVSGSDNNGGVCGGNEDTITNCYFDSDKYSGNAVGYNDGTVTNVNGKTTAQFNSGEVAYLLSQGENSSVWGQDLSTESSPALGGAKVYATKGCITYNNDGDESDKLHDYKDGVCADCGMIDPKLTNKNYPTEVGYTGEALAAPTAENFTYSGAGELTFTWYDGETKLNTPPTDLGEYTLVVAIGESGDYGASAITLTVKIVKGTPEYTVPVATATYGQTLKDVDLPDGFAWQDEETTSVGNAGAHTFKVTFTPTDTANYNVVEDIEVTINIAKADPTVTPIIEDKTYSEGDAIPAISTGEDDTPGTIKWLNVQLEALEAGENVLTWEFTPTDKDNYNVVTGTIIVAAETTTTTTTTTTTGKTTTTSGATSTTSGTTTSKASSTTTTTKASITATTTTTGKATTTSGATSTVSGTTSETATSAGPTNTTTSDTTSETTTSTATSETVTSAASTNTTTSDTTATTSETTTSTTTSETATSAGSTNTTTNDTTATTSETTTSTTTSETATSAGPTNTTTSDTTDTTTSSTTETTTTTTSGKTTESSASDTTSTATSTSTTVTTTSITTDTTTSTETTESTTSTETSSATISATTDTSETTATSDTTATTTNTTNTTVTGTTNTTTTTETEQTVLTGDANQDGKVDPDDAYLVLVYYAEEMVGKEHTMFDDPELEKLIIEALDIDKDGNLDADDAYFILLYYARVSVGSDVTWEDLIQ